MEDSFALYHIRSKSAKELLSVYEFYHALPLSQVSIELTLIVFPLILNIREVEVVDAYLLVGMLDFVIDAASAVELILYPVSFVGCFAVGIEELPIAIHPVVLPLTFV